MKKTILFALIAILFLAMFTGCRAYRRITPTTPGYEVTNTDGRATTRGFHYRQDGYVTSDRVARDHHHRDGSAVHGYLGRHDGSAIHGRHYRHDGLVTDTDGIIGNGTFADRPALDGHNAAGRATDGRDLAARHGTHHTHTHRGTHAGRTAGTAAHRHHAH